MTSLLAVLAASCGSSSTTSKGPVTLNWYILPNAADGQRQQMVR